LGGSDTARLSGEQLRLIIEREKGPHEDGRTLFKKRKGGEETGKKGTGRKITPDLQNRKESGRGGMWWMKKGKPGETKEVVKKKMLQTEKQNSTFDTRTSGQKKK